MSIKELNDKTYNQYEIIDIMPTKGMIKIILKDQEILITKSSYSNFYLYPHKIVNEEELKELLKEAELSKVKKYVSLLLSKGRYTSNQVKLKIKSKYKISDEDINSVLKEYLDSKIIDDKTYSLDYIEKGQNEGKGYKFLVHKLKEKGVSDEILDSIEIKEFQQNDEETIYVLINKLNNKKNNVPLLKKKNDIYQECFKNGYDSSLIKEAIDDFYSHVSLEDLQNERNNLKRKMLECYNSLKIKTKSSYELKRKLIASLISKGYSYNDILEEIEVEGIFND